MKTSGNYFLLTLIGILFFSCTSDNSETREETLGSLLGKWQLTGEIEDGVNLNLSSCEKEQTFDFKEAGTGIFKELSADGMRCGFTNMEITYTISPAEDLKITYISDNITIIHKIKTLNETELVFEDFSEFGEVIPKADRITFKFKRVE